MNAPERLSVQIACIIRRHNIRDKKKSTLPKKTVQWCWAEVSKKILQGLDDRE